MAEQLPLIPKQMPRWFWPLVILLILSFTGFAGTLVTTMAVRRNSEPVRLALALAQKDARVAALAGPGESVGPGFLVVGDSKTVEGTEVCRWQFALKGSRGEGLLRLNATRSAGDGPWTVDYLQAYLPAQGSDMLTLLGDPAQPPLDFATTDSRRGAAQTQLALAQALKDPRVQALGMPVEAGYWVTGDNPATTENTERCAWSFKLRGTKTEGKLRFKAARAKNAREWTLEELVVGLPESAGSMEDVSLPLPAAPASPK